MARYVETISTGLSPEAAFAYVADFRNFERWDPGVKSSAQVAGDGPGAAGGYDVTVAGFRGTMTLRYEVTAFNPPTRVVIRAETPRLRSVDTVTISARDQGSTVVYEATLVLRGVFGIADPLLSIGFRRIAKRAGAGLRAALTERARS